MKELSLELGVADPVLGDIIANGVERLQVVDDFQIALLFSVLIFVTLACLKITGLVKKTSENVEQRKVRERGT